MLKKLVREASTYTLSLSGACQEDVATSTSVRHAGLSQASRLADARPKLSGRRSSSTVLSQVCMGLPVLRRQSLGGPRMQAWRAREWSWLASARQRWPKKDRCRQRIVSDMSGCPVRDRTTSLETTQQINTETLQHQKGHPDGTRFIFSKSGQYPKISLGDVA